MNAVGFTENAKGDNKKFEIWSSSREEVYIVQVNVLILFNFLGKNCFLFNSKYFFFSDAVFQAPSAEVKTTWVNEIRKVLTTQLEACRGKKKLTLHVASCFIQPLKRTNL